MRWELYPTPNETIVFGAFYKYFRNPIENQLTGVTGVNTYTFIQAESAENFGVELELRKNLGSKFTAVLNASYIVSNVTNGDSIRLNETITLPTLNSYPEKRVMYGQSPYLINAGIFYNDEVSKWQVSLLYNIFGRRLFAIGNITTARSLYEMPRHGLDLTVSKALRNGLEIRFGAQDLLNPAFKVVEDSFENGKGVLNSVERKNIAFQSRRGQYFTLGLNYKF
jgi:outer membrane receptor protein involved in Fe transport